MVHIHLTSTQIFFHSTCTILYSHLQWISVALLPHRNCYIHFLFCLLLFWFSHSDMKWYAVVILISVPLMTGCIEQLLMCLFAILVSSLVNVTSLVTLEHFSWMVCFLIFGFCVFLYILWPLLNWNFYRHENIIHAVGLCRVLFKKKSVVTINK